MTTRLSFEAPADLSVGNVSISGESGTIHSWTATPDARGFSADVSPGFYSAEIAPAGAAPQSVVFEVKAGRDNAISMPSFSSLLANSGNTTFLGMSDPTPAIEALFGGAHSVVAATDASSGGLDERPTEVKGPAILSAPAEATSRPRALSHSSGRSKRITIGLSREQNLGRENYRPLVADVRVEMTENRLALSVTGVEDALAGRVRLTTAIEGVRTERLFLPLYGGGTQVVVVPSPLSASDVQLEVLPSDPRLRALGRALMAGSEAEANAALALTRTKRGGSRKRFRADPWEAMLSALLLIRFPAVKSKLTPRRVGELVELAPWAYDTHVIRACDLLFTAGRDATTSVITDALAMLKRAQTLGSPYFSYTNELFAQVVDGIYFTAWHRGDKALSRRAASVRDRWQREHALQSKAGVSFSWLARDQELLEEGLLEPERDSSGRVGRSSAPIFAGRLLGGMLQLDAGRQRPKDRRSPPGAPNTSSAGSEDEPTDCPALKRPPGPSEDPNLGRFGGASVKDGFRLDARFSGPSDGDDVTVSLTVTAERGVHVPPGSVAWFCLHPTFPWRWVKVLFGDGRAALSVQAWGGFTVGVWLPESRVELEADLSILPDAPHIIREL